MNQKYAAPFDVRDLETSMRAGQDMAFTSDYDGSIQRYIVRVPETFVESVTADVLIAFHGHGSDRNQFAYDSRPECRAVRDVAATHGMICVSPDYRAKTSWMGPAAEADVVQIIHECKANYKVGRIFLCGGSMGGTSALTFAVLHPEMIAGVAAMNPMVNHLEFEGFQDAISRSFGGSKKEMAVEYKKRSAEYFPEKIIFPVGITVGGKDTQVPPHSAIRFANVLIQTGKEVCLIHRPETGHETNYEDSRAILEFMMDQANKELKQRRQKKRLSVASKIKKGVWQTEN